MFKHRSHAGVRCIANLAGRFLYCFKLLSSYYSSWVRGFRPHSLIDAGVASNKSKIFIPFHLIIILFFKKTISFFLRLQWSTTVKVWMYWRRHWRSSLLSSIIFFSSLLLTPMRMCGIVDLSNTHRSLKHFQCLYLKIRDLNYGLESRCCI